MYQLRNMANIFTLLKDAFKLTLKFAADEKLFECNNCMVVGSIYFIAKLYIANK